MKRALPLALVAVFAYVALAGAVVGGQQPGATSASCEHISIAGGEAWVTTGGYYPRQTGDLVYGPVGAGTYPIEPSWYYVRWTAPADYARQRVWVAGCNPGYPAQPSARGSIGFPIETTRPTMPPTDVGSPSPEGVGS